MYLKLLACSHEVALPQPEGYVDQTNKGWNLDQRADHAYESLSRVQPEDRHRDGNRQLEIVACCREGKRRRLCIVSTQLSSHPEAHQEHDQEIDQERHSDANHIERQLHDKVALETEHHQDGE